MLINRKDFLLKEIPEYHPQSSRYADYWRTQKKRCIEGYWESGYWMPGNLYFYVNFGVILGNKNSHDKVKRPIRPFLRDLEWEFFYNWTEARGFSGFEKDLIYTCNRFAEPKFYKEQSDFEKERFRVTTPNAFTESGTLKKYIPAREYLRKKHPTDMGRALFENQSKDYMMMGSRGFGKSYSVGVGIVLHEWLFDGQSIYVPPEERDEREKPKSVTVVGAGDSKYSGDLLSKTRFALKELPGSQRIGNKFFPSPFYKNYMGSWNSGSDLVQKYKKKIGGKWKEEGSFSEIKHRSFSDNPFAANGIRAGVMVFEEVGMFSNLIASRNASVECQMDGSNKYGSMMFLGTGGDMDKGTLDAAKMFNDPETFNLLEFDNVWENTSRKIGYFVPAYMGLNQYKDKNGFTQEEPARQYLEGVRAKLRASKSGSSALDDELQNRPLVPSEVFLTKRGNIFPVAELRERLVTLENDDNFRLIEKPVSLYFSAEAPTGVDYHLDLERKLLPLNDFPLTEKQSRNRDGCVVIYEFPVEVAGEIPSDMYYIGHDPYASDDPDGNSLGAIYVFKNKKYMSHGFDEIVATFIGRPHEGRHVINENLYKLSLFYGSAKIYFENAVGNVKEYFEKVKRLDLLARQPVTVLNSKKAAAHSRTSTPVYGYPMSNRKFKSEALQYLRDWLLEVRGTDNNGRTLRNLDLIPDKGLLKELIHFDMDGNYDRVMAFMGCIIALEENYNRYRNKIQQAPNETLDFLLNNKFISKRSNNNWKL
jgi:hypothetical protein